MRLALSVRVAESFEDKTKSRMSLAELTELARRYGFQALCMRASQVGIHSSDEVIQQAAKQIRSAGLKVSMVTGDFAIPQNDDVRGPACLRNITPYLDLAERLGADLIRVCMKHEEDIFWAQRACDEAIERGIRLAHQSHTASLFETVSGALDVLKRVNRPNFGLIYEPANWMLVGEPYAGETLVKLQPYIFNVYVQNHRLDPQGQDAVVTWKKGIVKVNHVGVWEAGGVDFEAVFEGLHAIGYSGYVRVHQAFWGVMSVDEAVKRSVEYLRRLLS